MKIYCLLTITVLLLFTHTNFGQSASTDQSTKRVYLNSVLGLSFPGTADLNAELTKGGFLPITGAYFTRGAGLLTLFPKVRLATILNFSSYSGTNTDQNRSTWVRGSTAGLSLGILIRNTDRVQVIPYAGLAYSWFGTRLAKSAPVSTTFGGYVGGPANQQYVGTEQVLGNVGLHLAKPGIGRGVLQKVMVGVRAGYFIPLATPSWQTNDIPLSDGPRANTGGTYLHLVIGSSL